MRLAMRLFVLIALLPLLAPSAKATDEVEGPVLFALEGDFVQATEYTYTITADPGPGASDISINVPFPATRRGLGYREQRNSGLRLTWDPQPDTAGNESDDWGNEWSAATWAEAAGKIASTMSVRCHEDVTFGPIHTWIDAESTSYPEEIRTWLQPDESEFIQSDHFEIRALAETLSAGTRFPIEVVGRVLAWVHENVRIASCDESPEGADALWTLEHRVGICVNFANLSVALLRAAGIPAIPVSGVMADAEDPGVGHAWIAVYLADRGWLEFESMPGMPSAGTIPSTILIAQHITVSLGPERGISNAPFEEAHSCDIRIEDAPREAGFLLTELAPGDAASWVLSVRSPMYYEAYEYHPDYGYRDLPVSLTLDGVPAGWHASLSMSDFTIRKLGSGFAPVRSVLLTVHPPAGADAGTQHLLSVTARDTGVPGNPIIGALSVAVTIKGAP